MLFLPVKHMPPKPVVVGSKPTGPAVHLVRELERGTDGKLLVDLRADCTTFRTDSDFSTVTGADKLGDAGRRQ